jgi:hypothetical protein
VQYPRRQIVFADLDRDALRAVSSLDLAAMLDDVEAVVACRNLLPGPDIGASRLPESADQGAAGRVIIRLDAFDLNFPVYPGDRVHTHSAVNLACTDAMSTGMASASGANLERPAALERFDVLGPPEIEWLQLLNCNEFNNVHVQSPAFISEAIPVPRIVH